MGGDAQQQVRRLAVWCAIVALATLALAGCGGGRDDPVIVRGDTTLDVRGNLFEVMPPYFIALYGGPNREHVVAEGETDSDGRFVLRGRPSARIARDLVFYITDMNWSEACAHVDLPPLWLEGERWVGEPSGAPVTLNVTLREPARAGGPC